MLERKVRRRAEAAGEDPAGHGDLIAATVARFVELGFVDDSAYAELKLAGLRRQGASTRKVVARLSEKGVSAETLRTALDNDETAEADAAERYAKRRRLGPYRMRERAERRDRDLAAMMRAGFAFALSAAIIDRNDDDDGADEDEFEA